MGVSGSGKSTVAQRLAATLDVEHAEGDDFHSPANVAKMRGGVPLDDADRAEWLQALTDWLSHRGGAGGVLSASALRRSYRDLLREAAPGVVFLHLHGSPTLLLARMKERRGHFMPVTLLDSQLATLEPLGDDEAGLTVDAATDVEGIVEQFVAWSRRARPT